MKTLLTDKEKLKQVGGPLREVLKMLGKSERGLEDFLDDWAYPRDDGSWFQTKYKYTSPGVESMAFVEASNV